MEIISVTVMPDKSEPQCKIWKGSISYGLSIGREFIQGQILSHPEINIVFNSLEDLSNFIDRLNISLRIFLDSESEVEAPNE